MHVYAQSHRRRAAEQYLGGVVSADIRRFTVYVRRVRRLHCILRLQRNVRADVAECIRYDHDCSVNASDTLYLSLSVFSGEVGVYVSSVTDWSNPPTPTPGNSQWAIANYDNRVITLAAGDPRRSPTGQFRIGVYGVRNRSSNTNAYAAAHFTIVATYPGERLTSQARILADSLVQRARGVTNRLAYFALAHPKSGCPFSVSLTSFDSSTDPDLYVASSDGTKSESSVSFGSDSVYFDAASSIRGIYYVLVRMLVGDQGFVGNSEYTLLYVAYCNASNSFNAERSFNLLADAPTTINVEENAQTDFIQIEEKTAAALTAAAANAFARKVQMVHPASLAALEPETD